MVAPSFQKFEFIGDVYVSAGKKYIQVKNPKPELFARCVGMKTRSMLSFTPKIPRGSN